jgi:hypothetical protein
MRDMQAALQYASTRTGRMLCLSIILPCERIAANVLVRPVAPTGLATAEGRRGHCAAITGTSLDARPPGSVRTSPSRALLCPSPCACMRLALLPIICV